MRSACVQVLSALQAALFARDLYGSDHAALAQHTARAAHLLAEALKDRPSIEILVIEDRVVVDGAPLEGAAILRDHLLRRLHVAGVGSIAFHAGATAAEFASTVEQISRGDGTFPANSEHVRFGRLAVTAGATDATSTPKSAAFSTSEASAGVAAAWEEAGSAQSGTGVSLEGVVGSICAAVMLGRSALLPLANIRNHDEYTYLHTVNVGMLSAALAERVGLRADMVGDITTAALLHDIGKQVMPVEILNKKGLLTPAERLRVMQHPVDGARILLERRGVPDLAPIVAYEHHMHLNGSGYPRRKAGRAVHLSSQIVQLADVYDALRTHRPYRAAMDADKVHERLLEGAGTLYDADLVKVFLETVAEKVAIDPAPTQAKIAA